MDNLSYTEAFFVSKLSKLKDPEDIEKITDLLLGLYICRLPGHCEKSHGEDLLKKIEEFQEENIFFPIMETLRTLDLIEVNKTSSFFNILINNIKIKNKEKLSILVEGDGFSVIPHCHAELVSASKEIPKQVRDDNRGATDHTFIQDEHIKNFPTKKGISSFIKKLNSSFETHKIKRSRYEARFFWPSSLDPEVYDLQGLIFNEKYFSHTLTTDKYIVTQNNHNIKMRENEWQVKEYIENINSITQFKKKKTIEFPVKSKKIEKILQQKMGSMVFETPDDLLQKLSEFPGISWVEVLKERRVRKMTDHTKIEISLIKIQGTAWKTICIESKSLEKVLAFSFLINQKHAEKLSYDAFLRKYGLSPAKTK